MKLPKVWETKIKPALTKVSKTTYSVVMERYRYRPMLIIILIGAAIAAAITMFVIKPLSEIVLKEAIQTTHAGAPTYACGDYERDELQVAKIELARGMLSTENAEIDLRNSLKRSSDFSYCEDTLEASVQAAERLHGYANTNKERIYVANALMRSLENSAAGFAPSNSLQTSAVILIESYMKTIRDNHVSTEEEQIVRYRGVAYSLSEQFRTMGYQEKAEYWLDEYVKYKLFGKVPVLFEKYQKADEAVSKAANKLSENLKKLDK